MADRLRQKLIFAHQEWLGFVQPVGVVVAPSVHGRRAGGAGPQRPGTEAGVLRAAQGRRGRDRRAPRTKPSRRVHGVPRLGGRRSRRCGRASRDAGDRTARASGGALGHVGRCRRRTEADAEWTMLIRHEPGDADLDKAPRGRRHVEREPAGAFRAAAARDCNPGRAALHRRSHPPHLRAEGRIVRPPHFRLLPDGAPRGRAHPRRVRQAAVGARALRRRRRGASPGPAREEPRGAGRGLDQALTPGARGALRAAARVRHRARAGRVQRARRHGPRIDRATSTVDSSPR